jgi:hypothetical protein
MAEYGRYGETANAERDYGRDREHERERPHERGRGSIFGRDERGRDEGRERRGFFGDERGRSYEPRGRHDRDRERDRERTYGYDDTHRGLPIDETGRLIASNKVEGTPVYGRNGDRLGTIYNFMVDKFSGQVEYAVMTYGGFLGVGQRYYPLPWRILDYDIRQEGYRIDMSERDFERAPSFTRQDEPRFDRAYGRRVNDYYGLDY